MPFIAVNQIFANIIITFGWVTLVALGFSLIYHVAGFFHIAHGVIMYMGACLAAMVSDKLATPAPVAVFIGISVACFLGICAELFVYRPLRNKGSHPLIMLLASIGLMLFLQSVAGLLWGVDPIPFARSDEASIIHIMGARITTVQLYIVLVALLSTGVTFFLIYKTSWGVNMRAVAGDKWLAEAVGIPLESLIFYTFALASGLAGLAGALIAMDVAASPDMAMNALLLGVVAAIIGGAANPVKIILGALIVSTLKHITMWFGPTLWSDALLFGLLLFFILIKGNELLGVSSTPR